MTIRRRRLLPSACALLASFVLAGCHMPGESPPPQPSAAPSQRPPFTVLTTDKITATDPVAVTDAASAVVSLNVFQRLMTAEPGEAALKPDAARDCVFTAATVYTCTLQEKQFFHNGHRVTSADVKFSISRAQRLGLPGGSAPLLASLRRIETPDPLTVRFVLSRVDTQFGWALASPAASIVDSRVYPADRVRPPSAAIVGSGPFRAVDFSDGTLTLRRYANYLGRNPAQTSEVVYRTVADSASLEEAMAKRTADVVWRGLSAAAITRYAHQAQLNQGRLTDSGYTLQALNGTRVRMLQWSPSAPTRDNRAVRDAVDAALQPDRTLDSVVPGGVLGHVSAFPAGGKARPKISWAKPILLTLGWDTTMPDGRDAAILVRARLEATGGLRVRLRPGSSAADLTLVDRKAWTATGQSWLQPYLAAPLPGTRALLATLEERYRSRTSEPEALRLLAALQRQAAVDATVVPLSQSDEYVFARQGVTVSGTSFGPGWQLGLFGMSGG